MNWLKYKTLRPRRIYGDVEENNSGRFWKKFQPQRKIRLKTILLAGLVLILACFVAGTIVIAVISKDLPDPEKLSERQVSQSTKIYDRSGEHLLYEVYQDQKRTMVELEDVDPLAIKATVAIEDKNFYTHKGVRLISIIRAGFNNLIGRKTGSGGASTITQQVIKNTIVGGEHSYFRKIKEAILALRLEKKYSKDQILKMYLNESPYGSTNYGIEAAAQSYFKKKASELTLAEGATLAALLKQPTRYLNNPEMLQDRRDTVLRLMFEQGYISEDEKEEAQNEELKISRSAGIANAPHFVLYVRQLLAEQYGENMVDHGGLKVVTSLDFDKQKIAEAVVKELGDTFAEEANANNAALVALSPQNAEILAMVGSRDFFNEEIDGQFNVAVLGKRQPGSSFKPFVYTAAFEKGYTPDTVLYDVITNFDMRTGGDYTPKNYDSKEHGLITIRRALQGSLNIPAVKALYLVGEKYMAEFAERFGYTTLSEGNYGLSLVLGGAEVNLLEHTNAYATLADNGVYHSPVAILKIYDGQGEEIFSIKEDRGTEAIAPEIAATISNVLSDDVARSYMFGRNGILTLPDRPVAAKTGTTNDSKDAWTMGYVPSLATGVWVGNTIPSTMKGGGSSLAAKIWNRFMKEALASTTPETFPVPPINDANKAVLRGTDGAIKIKVNRINGRIASSSTPEPLVVEKEYLPPHDILYYVNKDDPRGPMPADPTVDPQYENWESALQAWAERERKAGKNIFFSEPPNEYDDFFSDPALIPTLEIVSPTPNQILNGRELNIDAQASAPRGIYQVIFKIDGSVVATKYQPPFTYSAYLKKEAKGAHILSVFASDDLGNSAYQEVVFNLQADLDNPDFDWVNGSPLTLHEDDFPYPVSLAPFRWDEIKNIQITLNGNGNNKLIYTFDHNDQLLIDKLNFTWKNYPGIGDFTLTGTMTDNAGRTKTKSLEILAR